MPLYGGIGVGLNLGGQSTNQYSLQAGEVWMLPPGWWHLGTGLYTTVQVLDPVTTIWRDIGADSRSMKYIHSDGVNYRVANQTGCVIGALLTNGGTLYTSPPTVTISAGGAKAFAIVGGAVSTVTSIPNAGTNYVYAPQVVIPIPPTPGIAASGYSTISGGAVTTVTITNQGAGYTSAPPCFLINDPRDTTGAGATCTLTLTGSQTVTGVLVTDHGNAVTSLPTISFAGGGGSGAVAVAIMDWSVTAYVAGTPGAGYVAPVMVSTVGTGIPTTATAYTNPNTQASLLRTRPPTIFAALSSTGITATSQIVLDGGHIGGTASNIGVTLTTVTAYTTVAALTLAVGGQNDTVFIMKD